MCLINCSYSAIIICQACAKQYVYKTDSAFSDLTVEGRIDSPKLPIKMHKTVKHKQILVTVYFKLYYIFFQGCLKPL